MTTFTHTVSSDTSRHDLLSSLATRVRTRSAGSDDVQFLEGLVFHALHGQEGEWSREFGDHPDGVWHRRDPEDSAAWDVPPAYLRDYEAAALTLPEGSWISTLQQTGPGAPWICVLLGTRLEKEDSTGHGPDLASAVVDAALMVRART